MDPVSISVVSKVPSVQMYLFSMIIKFNRWVCVCVCGGLGGGGGGDFEVSQHASKQVAIAQKINTRGGRIIYFLKALCLLFPKSLNWDP